MRLRFQTRTHYQIDEPRFLSLIVTRCSSPIRSDHRERVAARLESEIKQRERGSSIAAAKYAIDLARGLELLNDNHVWTPTGHLVNLATMKDGTSDTLELGAREQLAFFRVFLYGDGAALLYLAKRALDAGELPPPGVNWNDIANEMTESIYEEYLKLATSLQDRAHIRATLKRRRKNPYEGKSGPHQVFVHVQTMSQLGLLNRSSQNTRQYTASPHTDRLRALVERVPDLLSLDRIAREDEWEDLAFRLWAANGARSRTSEDDILGTISADYTAIANTGVSMIPLHPLVTMTQIEQIQRGTRPSTAASVLTTLREMERKFPRKVRFHVDRRGRPAFLKIDETILVEMSTLA